MARNDIPVALIAAVARNHVIGQDGAIPWRIPADMRFFKETTMGKPVVMGRKTFESFPKRPLLGRANIVVTRQPSWQADGAHAVPSLDAGLDLAAEIAARDGAGAIMVIGGRSIYCGALPHADRLYLTRVDADCEGDVKFPPFDADAWLEVSREAFPDDPEATYPAVLTILERR